jgi:hypothetical protein
MQSKRDHNTFSKRPKYHGGSTQKRVEKDEVSRVALVIE